MINLEPAKKMTWGCSDAEFSLFCRFILGLPLDGPPPYYHLIEEIEKLQTKEAKA